jgi:hypothetical protein
MDNYTLPLKMIISTLSINPAQCTTMKSHCTNAHPFSAQVTVGNEKRYCANGELYSERHYVHSTL